MKNILSLELLVILAALHLEVGCLEIVTSKCDPLKTLEVRHKKDLDFNLDLEKSIEILFLECGSYLHSSEPSFTM